ncbi:hypothetical protein [Inquilinus limosus]|uniref:Uncharacterized protein n=1 Tax=Inquilinus limosus TaxID=171674 RepID=A0A211ZHU0_9PROT|nr:hypothetical protein [Inquilinus limosus]OWJ64756.1 hypothetical protein BWR60_22980 [Inquilinus limosus]
MIDPFWLLFAAKLALTAGIVVTASLLVERSGPLLGAMIATLPISVGPAYVFLAMEHDAGFIAGSAVASLAINAATAVFLTLYSLLARSHGLATSLPLGLLGWAAAAFAISRVGWTLPGAVALNLAVFAACLPLALRRLASAPPVRAAGRRWDIPVRTAAVMALIAAVLLIGRALGPAAAGFAALAPVVTGSLALLLHPRIGGPATAAVFANALIGMVGYIPALALLHLAAPPLGSPAALGLGLAACVCWNAAALALRSRSRKAAPARP